MHAQVYESLTQSPDRFWGLMAQNTHVYLRTAPSVAPASIFTAVRNQLAQQNRDLVAFEPEPMDLIVADSIARQRFTMILFTGFAAVALLLASVGIYGVLSYVVGQRTQEIGIRMALGATRGNVQLTVIRDTLRLALAGIGLGTVAAIAVARAIASLLFGTQPTDPATFAGMILLLGGVALVAGYIPARRASRVDPMMALRNN